jgi:RNA polymerase sigma-70 factor (ECF subfamily)
LASEDNFSAFLRSVERRAFKRALYAVRDEDAALDIVQDAMLRLAERYADRSEQEWPLIFQRILSNATMDWFRRQKVRQAVLSPLSEIESAAPDGDFDLLEVLEVSDWMAESAADGAGRAQILQIIDEAVEALPTRQREAFLLRYAEEFDVSETAQAMGCSEGSVKTHCSRAIQHLAGVLKARGLAP